MTQTPTGTEPIRFVVAGAGAMGRFWIAAIEENADVDLVGVADVAGVDAASTRAG